MTEWVSGWQTWSPLEGIELEIFAAIGDQPGKLALITGGIHGDEYEGPTAIIDWTRTIDPHQLQGTVIAVPIANPEAFQAGTRTNPRDGLNLARCFPGRGAEPTQQLAGAFFRSVAAQADYLIDLHSGGVEYRFLPLAGFYGEPTDTNPSFAAARRFGLSFLWQLPATPGVLSYELSRLGRTVIGNEYLGAGQLSPEGRRDYASGISRCLAEWGFLRDTSSSEQKPRGQEVLIGDWLLASCDGLFTASTALGDLVDAGSTVAEILDARGRVLERFRSPIRGRVCAIRSKAGIKRGNWAVLIAQSQQI